MSFCTVEVIFDENEKPIDYRFLEVNPSFEKQTGLIGAQGRRMRELVPQHEDYWFDIYGKIAVTGEPARFENRAEQLRRWYDVYAFRVGQPANRQVAILFNDITKRRQVDEERGVTVRLLQLLHERNDLHDLMQAITALLRNWIGCEAIGIRLRSGEDFPYFETSGFPPAFIEKENRLCTYDLNGQILRDDKGHPLLDCMCGNVLCGRFDAAKPFFTSRGSFWTNCTTALLATTTEADRQSPTRNRCNGEGYESVALVPLRSADQIFGLLQINDRRPDRFTPEKIALFERLADSLAIALSQRQAQEALRTSEELYRSLFVNMLNGFAYCRMLFKQGEPLDFVYLSVNNAFEELTGLKNVVGKKVSEIIPGIQASDPELLEIYGQVALTGRPRKFERYIEALQMWFAVSVYSPGKEYFVAIFDVITERKLAEMALRRAEENFRRSLDESPLGVRIVTEKGETLYTNQAFLDIFGYDSFEDYNATPSRRRYTPESYSAFEMRREKRRRGDYDPAEYEIDIVRKDGTVRHLQVFRKEILWNAERQFQTLYLDITARKQAERKHQITLENLRNAVGTTIQVMVSAVETRDPYTAGHQLRTADLSRAIAMEMGLSQEKIEGIRIAGSVHDIGKLSTPAEILSKPTKLSEFEFALIKEHAQQGYDILKNVESDWPLAEMVYQHHERMDGSGYPRKLKGEEILLEARVLTVADVVEAMASHRPYRPGLGIDVALEEIEKNRGILYDNAVVDACLRLFRENGFQLEGTDFRR